ncbi:MULTISPECIES: hypothetical protein [Acinetobacter]|mgnify:FL=1|jgi:hypothetical protein|uniref:hypothetical protein n=1 Tax=Acinetobacter TaxID=469 RepID=UPI00148F01AF|nr:MULTISPECIES: hypothetical protein [Acinetobacter]|tara:strand:- start:38 stop:202 length:165 start_codon:yes stop_codon:yes gene_type:complete
MTKRYKALKPVGPWSKGDTIGDLPQVQIEKLLSDGLIIEVKTEPKLTKEVKANG